MKTKFKDFQQQMMYINKFINRFTDLDVKCQYCGEPAHIRYSRYEPYDVQFICKSCRKEKNIDFAYSRGEMLKDIPTIHVLDHITSTSMKIRLPVLRKEEEIIIDDILKNKLTKSDAISKYNITYIQLNKMITKYELYKDKNIKEKIEQISKNAVKVKLRKASLRKIPDSNNNISILKLEKNITNDDIVRLSNGEILSMANLSLICNGKIEPTIKTKCALANIFKVSVSDLFPKDWAFSKIYNYNDYINLNNKISNYIKEIYKEKKTNKEKKVVQNLANEFNVNTNIIYKILDNDYFITHNDLEIFIPILVDKYNKQI